MILRTCFFLALHIFGVIALELVPSDRYGTVPGLENCETAKKGAFDAACMDRNAKHILSYSASAPPLQRDAMTTSVPLVFLAIAGAFSVFLSALGSKRLTLFIAALAIYILFGIFGAFGPIEIAIILGIGAFLLVRSRAASAQSGAGQGPDRHES